MSEKYEVNIGDFTGKELDEAINQLEAVARASEVAIPEHDTFKNKTEQGDHINVLANALQLGLHRVADEEDAAKYGEGDVKPVVGAIILVGLNEDGENEETKTEETNDAAAGEGGDTAAEGDDTGADQGAGEEGAEGGDEGGDANTGGEKTGDEPSGQNNEPTPSAPIHGERRYKGELVVRTANKLMNGRMYVEVFTVTASYVLSPDEAKEAKLA